MSEKKPLDLTKTEDLIEIRWRRSTVPGILVAEASHLDFHVVLGMVYYRVRQENNSIEILQSFVMDWARRNGIRSKINDALFGWYDWAKSIRSSGATKDGEKFMRAAGYKKLKNGTWIVRRKRKRAKKKT